MKIKQGIDIYQKHENEICNDVQSYFSKNQSRGMKRDRGGADNIIRDFDRSKYFTRNKRDRNDVVSIKLIR